MKATYDEQANALYVRFTNAGIEMSEEVRPWLILDFDANGRIVALEMLDARKELGSRVKAASRRASGKSTR